MAEAHEGAVAEDEVERHGGDAEDHHPGQQGQDIAFRAGERGEERCRCKGAEEDDRHDLEPRA